MNYRHQVDICHAYHVVRKHGIPPEQIIVMMYDDIAFNERNPVQGNIINEPNGPNVYTGVVKDYTGDEVTPQVFLHVLSGDGDGVERLIGRKGNVIESGPNDRIFVYFADHGAPGLLAFPVGVLTAKELNDVLVGMHKNNQYKQMVLYVDACESGSMFSDVLRSDINIFATTSANHNESAYVCYCDNKRRTFLGDIYNVKWMQDYDVKDLSKETLQQQFRLFKNETHKSHVMEYGDLSLAELSVGDFQGNLSDNILLFRPVRTHRPNTIDAVRSEDVAFEIARRMKDSAALAQFIEQRDSTVRFFQDVVTSVSTFNYWTLHKMSVQFSDFTCYRKAVDQIERTCPGMELSQNDYALRSLRVSANLCEQNINIEKLLTGIHEIAQITPLRFV